MQFAEQQPFQLHVNPRGKTALMQVAGEFDLSAKKKFEAALAEVASTKPDEVILDLRDVSFIDSTGLRMILEAWNQSRRAGFDFAVLQASGQVERIFRETGLDQALPIIEGVPASD
jgi:anti-anti-sigma factor